MFYKRNHKTYAGFKDASSVSQVFEELIVCVFGFFSGVLLMFVCFVYN